MIDFHDLAGKRVALVIKNGIKLTFIPGVADLDEESEMFQIKPDDSTLLNEDESYGIPYNKVKVVTLEGYWKRKYNCDYGVEV